MNMVTKARRRMAPVSILQTDYEYCDVLYYAEGSRNDLGEPERTLTLRSSDVKCSIDPVSGGVPGHITRSSGWSMEKQGLVSRTTHILTLNQGTVIEAGNVVRNVGNEDFEVLHVADWHTHIECLLRKSN